MRHSFGATQRALDISGKLFTKRGPGIQRRVRLEQAGVRSAAGANKLYGGDSGIIRGRQRGNRRRGKQQVRSAATNRIRWQQRGEAIQTERENCE